LKQTLAPLRRPQEQALLSSYCAVIGVTWSAKANAARISLRCLIAALEENFDVD
jgi:hypothetical protein